MSKQFFDEHTAKVRWENSSDLRAEFNGDYEAYLAWARAESQNLIKRVGRSR